MALQTMLLYSFIFILMFYFLTCVGYLVFHRYFIIFPSRKLSRVPSDYQLQYEDVYFSARDKMLLNGWFINGDTKGEWKDFTVLLFPGNKGTISDFILQMKKLTGIGFNVFLFGYRGFGKSRKKWPVEDGVFKDSEAACEYLISERGIPANKIIFLGQSLGCAMAAFAASLNHPLILVLEGGFPSIADVAARAVRWLPLKILTMSRFDTKKYLEKVNCPVLIIHSREDKAIPLSDADALFKTVKGKKKKVVISGPHAKGLEYDSEIYLESIENYLRKSHE